jgi:hypothetical protein
VSLIAGVFAGLAIAVLEVTAKHGRIEMPRAVLSLSDSAPAVPFVLVPLALFWGWTWAAERWAGRNLPRLALFTLGFYAALALTTPVDLLVASSYDVERVTSSLLADPLSLFSGLEVFVLPAFIAAPLYWLFGSGRLPMNRFTLGVAYVVGPSLALLSPVATMGTVAGTAAGHAWRSPRRRNTIALLVIVLLLAVAFGLPYLLVQFGVAVPPARPMFLP